MHADNPNPIGFMGMLEATFPSGKESSPEPPQQTQRSMSGFGRMLEASRFGGEQNTIDRISRLSNNKGEKRILEKEEIDQMIKNVEERIIEKVTKALTEEKATASIDDSLKKLEERIPHNTVAQSTGVSQNFGCGFKGMVDEMSGREDSTPLIQRSAEKRFTMLGLNRFEIISNSDGTMSLKTPDPPPQQPRVPDPIPQCLVELAYHDRERMEKEKARRAALAKRATIRRGLGLKAMIEEAFR